MGNTENHHQPVTICASEELYDLSMLEEMDDNEYVLEMLNILLVEASADFTEMKKAIQAGKAETVCQMAHKLKTSAGIIQAAKLIALLEQIETIGKKGSGDKELALLVENAIHQYHSIEKELKVYMAALLTG
ncbi:MAG: Hpt domain-containing protein [Ferruginibacter sp.]